MARPRSIPGLLFHLATLHVARRPGWCAAALALVLAAAIWPRPSGDRRPSRGGSDLQAAVLKDGFALTYADDAGRRVVDLDAQGQVRREATLPQRGELRVVGTRLGAAVAWEGNKKIRLTRVEDDADMGTWGRSVRQLCAGVASNASRFAVGWLEADDTVWFVHGPSTDAAEAADGDTGEPIATSAALARNEWCGVASAEQNIALLWRNADRLTLAMCTRKACTNFPVSFNLDHRLPILGVGCLRTACLVAARDEAGKARVALLATTGRSKWSKPLDTASPTVSIIGAGDRTFVVGYAGPDGAEVVTYDRDGKAATVWRDPAATSAPVVAWCSGRLLIARFRGDALAHETIALAAVSGP